MKLTRTIYRCNYAFKGDFGSARQSKAFQTEQETRAYAESLKARGFLAVVGVSAKSRRKSAWETDIDHEITQPLDP